MPDRNEGPTEEDYARLDPSKIIMMPLCEQSEFLHLSDEWAAEVRKNIREARENDSARDAGDVEE